MATYTAPGVYVEEVPAAMQAIAGVGTSTAGFVGSAPSDIEPGTPHLVTNWSEFTTAFGEISESNRVLAHAVYGFLNNGGTRCFVAHVVPETATEGDEAAALGASVVAALEAFEAIDEIAIVAAPIASDAARKNVHIALTAHCEKMQDRFAILDCDEDATAQVEAPAESSYAAFYFPWIEVPDPLLGTAAVPPSGHLAGVYARSDATRGVHKAPANEVLRGVSGTATPVSRAHQAALNPAGVNCIRMFGSTPRVYGARTLDKTNPEWRYISTRRMVNYLRESIEDGTQWVVFEPNTPQLWAKITRNVSAFLHSTWSSGALFGATSADAFYVRCDAELNPPDARDNGYVTTEIGVAIAKPAEFVVFRLSQWSGAGS